MCEKIEQICENCGESANNLAKDDLYCDDLYCDDCFSELFETCNCCGEIGNKDDYFWSTLDACYYCEECFDNCTSFCTDCNEQVDNGDIEEDLCPSCFTDKYICCEGCHCNTLCEDAYHSQDGYSYCSDCYSDIYTSCDNCGNEILIEEVTHTDDGSYCTECTPSADFDIVNLDMDWIGKNSYSLIKSKRKYGIELETSEIDENMDWIKLIGWGVRPDESILGAEFVSPPLYGDDGFASIKEACDNLSYCSVDSSCGYHLHIEISDTNANQRKSIDLAYHFSKEIWIKFIDPLRSGNSYNKFNGKKLSEIIIGDDYTACQSRNQWINWHAFTKFGTLEIRAHEATLCYTAITNWIRAHASFIDYVRSIHWSNIPLIFQNKEKILEKFFHIWKDDDLYNYYMNKGGFPEKIGYTGSNQKMLFSTQGGLL